MTAISANTLFHFTSKQNLISILNSKGFFAKYSEEHFENILPTYSIYRIIQIPLISFCDLTLMQLASSDSFHQKHYGSYGIGLTKEWGIKNNVSPVIYVHKKSLLSTRLYSLMNILKKKKVKDTKKHNDKKLVNEIVNPDISEEMMREKIIREIRPKLLDAFKYIKPYKGRWLKRKRIKPQEKEVIYYNEREWRYCPPLKRFWVLSGIIKENHIRIKRYNKKLQNEVISFEPKEIKFIIIKSKKEKDEFINEINAIKSLKNSADKNDLITKIISFDELKEDY